LPTPLQFMKPTKPRAQPARLTKTKTSAVIVASVGINQLLMYLIKSINLGFIPIERGLNTPIIVS
jgi:hypothetical protein